MGEQMEIKKGSTTGQYSESDWLGTYDPERITKETDMIHCHHN